MVNGYDGMSPRDIEALERPNVLARYGALKQNRYGGLRGISCGSTCYSETSETFAPSGVRPQILGHPWTVSMTLRLFRTVRAELCPSGQVRMFPLRSVQKPVAITPYNALVLPTCVYINLSLATQCLEMLLRSRARQGYATERCSRIRVEN